MKCFLFFKLILLIVNLGYAQTTYTNPVYKGDFADPTIILKSKGRIMLIDRLRYKNSWPFIETYSPGITPL